MRLIILGLTILLLFFQYKLWLAPDGIRETIKLKKHIAAQMIENQRAEQRNQILEAEVNDLKRGQDALEERARKDLGMVKEGEQFYQFVDPHDAKTPSSHSQR